MVECLRTIPSAWIQSNCAWFWTDDYSSTMGGVHIHTEDTFQLLVSPEYSFVHPIERQASRLRQKVGRTPI